MEKIYIRDDFIKLGQALKLSGIAESGIDAKMLIIDGLVKVNGSVEIQRGKKIVPGDVISCEGEEVVVEKSV